MDTLKGGHIAIYSAISVEKNIQDRIISVKNYDGPGFDKKIVESASYTQMLNKITTYIPQDSIIGRLLEHKENCIIVKSNEKGIFQHDILSWQVIGTKPVVLDKLTNNSNIFNQTVNTWLKETNNEQRKIFIDGIFQILSATKASTFKELSESRMKYLNTLLKNYNNINEDEKKVINKMILEFVNSARKSIIHYNS